MKLIKSFRFICMLLLCTGFFIFSCSKIEPESLTPTKPKISDVINLVEIKNISPDNNIYQKFIQSDCFQTLKSSIDDLELVDIQLATFSREEIGGLVIKLSPNNGFERDIMVTYNKTFSNGFYALVREHNISSTKGKNSGEISWYTLGHAMINKMKISENRVVDFKTYDPQIVSKSSRTQAWVIQWVCTNSQFNTYYQYAKNLCEDNWNCDLVCNFAPCGITYAAWASAKCTNWIYIPDCTYSIPGPPVTPTFPIGNN